MAFAFGNMKKYIKKFNENNKDKHRSRYKTDPFTDMFYFLQSTAADRITGNFAYKYRKAETKSIR